MGNICILVNQHNVDPKINCGKRILGHVFQLESHFDIVTDEEITADEIRNLVLHILWFYDGPDQNMRVAKAIREGLIVSKRMVL